MYRIDVVCVVFLGVGISRCARPNGKSLVVFGLSHVLCLLDLMGFAAWKNGQTTIRASTFFRIQTGNFRGNFAITWDFTSKSRDSLWVMSTVFKRPRSIQGDSKRAHVAPNMVGWLRFSEICMFQCA